MRWLVVLSCVLVATSASAEQRLVVGESTRGVFYWHGHRIAPPYTIEVGYEVGPETTWTATYLNGRPIERHDPPAPPAVDFADPTLTPDQQALERISYREMRFDAARGYNLHDRVARQAEILRGEQALVDSVVIRPSDETTVFWHGQPNLDGEIQRYQAGEDVPLAQIHDARILQEPRSPPPEADLAPQLSFRPWSPPPCGLPRAVAQSEARPVALETIASSEALVLAGGRELRPPFELAAECVADPDTTWMTLSVSGELAWRRPSKPVNWIVQRGAPCGRPPDFGVLSFVLRSGGLATLAADSSLYVPRVRRSECAAVADSVRAATGGQLAHSRIVS